MAGQKTDARDVHVGQRIALQRKKAALTQKRVAQSFGMSAAQLQKYEKGTNRISAIHLDTFSRLTGVPVAYFFEGMQRLDDVPPEGFAERPQQAFAADSAADAAPGSWQGLAEVVAEHVKRHFTEDGRKDFAAAIQVLGTRLGT
ncbi:helix-turn-helix transcriptional regulator [Methylobacterium sp. Leaf466]|uniref:helix-turn-helix domain-containing protein n=1 Tax=Methylobacterium sp. Leaf466 TaxID=1736386 RepID=UPI0006F3AFB3|nr:helix-turn-helix transcriptional regulator [Methylobacterium sp. Leaf466]KQT80792.1 XRE family transcriptional regulator [Methylobacterium sp. Leaf466]